MHRINAIFVSIMFGAWIQKIQKTSWAWGFWTIRQKDDLVICCSMTKTLAGKRQRNSLFLYTKSTKSFNQGQTLLYTQPLYCCTKENLGCLPSCRGLGPIITSPCSVKEPEGHSVHCPVLALEEFKDTPKLNLKGLTSCVRNKIKVIQQYTVTNWGNWFATRYQLPEPIPDINFSNNLNSLLL